MIRTSGVSKSFNGIFANESIDFETLAGEVHAILGENGAGKTTLMRMLTGIYKPDTGEIYYKGERLNDLTPIKAKELGIGMIHQHILLIDNLTVWQNIVVGNEMGRLFLEKDRMLRRLEELKNTYGLNVDLEATVGEISTGHKQQVELLKLLYRDFDLLIFDEPTALLAPKEIEGLYKVMAELRENGKAIIFITHKLDEIFRISDKVSTLSQGKMMNTYKTASITREELIKELFDIEIDEDFKPAESTGHEEELLFFRRLTKDGRLDIKGLALHKGEILGIAGVEGNGQREFLELIFDVEKGVKDIFYKGKPLKRGLRSLSSLIPEDRSSEAMLPEDALWKNFLLNINNMKRYSHSGIIDRNEAEKRSSEIIENMDVKASSFEAPMNSLSGGNQQKFILGRELGLHHEIIVAKNPTRGLDVKSERFVHEYLKKETEKGKAVLLFSTELRELMSVCQRIAVLYNGRIFHIFDSKEFSRENIGRAMLGIKENDNG